MLPYIFPCPASLLTFTVIYNLLLLFPTTKYIDPDTHVYLILFTNAACPWQQKFVLAAHGSTPVHCGGKFLSGNWESSHNSPYAACKILQFCSLQCGIGEQGQIRFHLQE